MMSHPPSCQLTLNFEHGHFELSNGGQSYQGFVVQKFGLLVKVMVQNLALKLLIMYNFHV